MDSEVILCWREIPKIWSQLIYCIISFWFFCGTSHNDILRISSGGHNGKGIWATNMLLSVQIFLPAWWSFGCTLIWKFHFSLIKRVSEIYSVAARILEWTKYGSIFILCWEENLHFVTLIYQQIYCTLQVYVLSCSQCQLS